MAQTNGGLPDGYKPGLEGVIAGVSSICEVDAVKDALSYVGYPAHELAAQSNYLEVAYLLLHQKLPSAAELETFRQNVLNQRALSVEMITFLKSLPKKGDIMTGLAAAVSYLHMQDPAEAKIDATSNLNKAINLIAKSPTIVAALHRIHQGKDPIAPNPTLDHAANFLYMVTGKDVDSETAKAFDSTMILYAEHGYNASTFSALVTASTLTDLYSAIVAAIGTLKGPLHGGANEGAIEMLLKIGDDSKAEAWVKDALARKEKIMGFGHRVYRKQDSRAPIMKVLAEKIAKRVGDKKLFPLSCKVEEIMVREKDIFPNVDYHCAVFYYLIGLPIEVYTAIFAMARMAGWTAHVIEQYATNRLIRPDCHYSGPRNVSYAPIGSRS
jgi:citrate synthase